MLKLKQVGIEMAFKLYRHRWIYGRLSRESLLERIAMNGQYLSLFQWLARI